MALSQSKASQRISIQLPGSPRSPNSGSAPTLTRSKRISVNLPLHSSTSAAFISPITGTSTLTANAVKEERARYTMLVSKSATSEALMMMPNVATKPESIQEDINDGERKEIACNLPKVAPSPMSNKKLTVEDDSRRVFPSGYHTQSKRSPLVGTIINDFDRDEMSTTSAKRSSMNPNAASFTPNFAKGGSDYAASDHSGGDSNRPSRRSTVDMSRDSLVAGLGISSPTSETNPRHSLTVNTKVFSPGTLLRQERSTFGSSEMSPRPLSAIPADFNPDEFRINIMRQISDQLETGLDRHFSQLVSATSALPLSPATSDNDGSGINPEENTINSLKRQLRSTSAELERVKSKNQELRDANHKLELQHMEASHHVARLQDYEVNNQILLSRVKELESCASSVDSTETSSMNGHHHRGNHQRSSSTASNGATHTHHIQRLISENATLKAERDAFKIKSWELEKKPFAQQHQQRPAHFVDLENERNRLVEELSAKTVAMEDLWNKNETLMVRAKEYEKRVWELEGQCAALEEECSTLPKIRSELVEMEARAVAADSLVEKMQDMEGQVALIKSLQDRISEIETTNAELDHSNWDLSERLNIANNQHALLTKEYEAFRTKDKDDRKYEFLVNKNRELEALLQEQSKISPDYKEEYERVSIELEKLKIRLPQLEGQSKQVMLLRNKILQLEKQIKTMEELEPRLAEIHALNERNIFLEGELGELEQLRAREMELEAELSESKARLAQFETNKTRVASLSGIRSPGRARSGSVTQHNPSLFQDGDESASILNIRSGSPVQQSLSRRTSLSGASSTPMSPSRVPSASAWPSGRSSMSLTAKRVSTTSNGSGSILNNGVRSESPLEPSLTTEEPESMIDPSPLTAAPIEIN